MFAEVSFFIHLLKIHKTYDFLVIQITIELSNNVNFREITLLRIVYFSLETLGKSIWELGLHLYAELSYSAKSNPID